VVVGGIVTNYTVTPCHQRRWIVVAGGIVTNYTVTPCHQRRWIVVAGGTVTAYAAKFTNAIKVSHVQCALVQLECLSSTPSRSAYTFGWYVVGLRLIQSGLDTLYCVQYSLIWSPCILQQSGQTRQH
jgi:hypothetical protein